MTIHTIPSDLDTHIAHIIDVGSGPPKTMTMRQIHSMEKSKFPLRIKIRTVVLAENKAVIGKCLLFRCAQFITILRSKEVTSSLPCRDFPRKVKVAFSYPVCPLGGGVSIGKTSTLASFLMELWLGKVDSSSRDDLVLCTRSHLHHSWPKSTSAHWGRVWFPLKFKVSYTEVKF